MATKDLRRHYGTNFTQERPHDGGSSFRDTAEHRKYREIGGEI
ncbi:hypothetical protein FACS189449_11420 [Alphaproteobacteria bacterium]|nr:hypothetical protein FACS189449_11420 [Alphaproteobacteria bacterium]